MTNLRIRMLWNTVAPPSGQLTKRQKMALGFTCQYFITKRKSSGILQYSTIINIILEDHEYVKLFYSLGCPLVSKHWNKRAITHETLRKLWTIPLLSMGVSCDTNLLFKATLNSISVNSHSFNISVRLKLLFISVNFLKVLLVVEAKTHSFLVDRWKFLHNGSFRCVSPSLPFSTEVAAMR